MFYNKNLINLHNQIGYLNIDLHDSFFYRNPVFIVSTPRSGSNLLFELLTTLDNVWTIGNESHGVFSQFPHLQFEDQSLNSACLNESHADEKTSYLFKLALFSLLRNNKNERILQSNFKTLNNNVFIEKTPRNALNIPFIKTVFPNAKFIYLYREPKQNISSIIEAWKTGMKTGQFVTFPNLPNWHRKNWCLLLPKGWKKMNGKSLADIAYFQWRESNNAIITNLKKMPSSHWKAIEYKKLIKNPYKQIKSLIDFCSINTHLKKSKYKKLSHSKTTVSNPSKNKWKVNKTEMKTQIKYMKKDYKSIKQFVATSKEKTR